jgi:hypothetical protein
MIIIDGKAQTGKSTLGDHIAKKYDPNYTLVYTVDDILNQLYKLRDLWFAGKMAEIYNRWIFWDEPQLETPKQEYWSQRNMIIQAFTSSFGFLHNHLILALPNIKGLSDIILTNLSLRFSVKSYLDRDKKVVRKAYVKVPLFNEMKQKFYWTTCEEYRIPEWTLTKEYYDAKANNFFVNQLDKWKMKLGPSFKIPEKPIIDVSNLEVPE